MEVQPFTPAFFGLHAPQRLLLPAFLRAQRLPGLRVGVSSGHGSGELEKSPVETKITASRSGGSSAAAKWESEESEPPMDPVHNKYVTQRLKEPARFSRYKTLRLMQPLVQKQLPNNIWIHIQRDFRGWLTCDSSSGI